MEIKLKAIPPTTQEPIYKASLHKTGKIGLAIDTSKKFGLTTNKAIELLINEADDKDKSIYGIVKNAGEPNTYKILKAGDYHSINSISFFEAVKPEYGKIGTSFVVTEIFVDGQGVLKFEPVKQVEKTKSSPVFTGVVTN